VVSYEWRGPFRNAELSALHAAGFGQPAREHDWQAQAERHSLGWVCARDGAGLAGFINVAWDGGSHAFILDTVVAPRLRHHGTGTRLVAVAAEGARAAGCVPGCTSISRPDWARSTGPAAASAPPPPASSRCASCQAGTTYGKLSSRAHQRREESAAGPDLLPAKS